LPNDPLQHYPGYALRRASLSSTAVLAKRLETLELRPAEASVLMVIGANPGITQSEIGRMLDIAGANMAPLVNRLHVRGVLEKQPLDGRSHALSLSASGRGLCARTRKAFESHEEELLGRLPKRLREPFLEAVNLLWKAE
jgi:DNA-binding MarR family transcriptional regulator